MDSNIKNFGGILDNGTISTRNNKTQKFYNAKTFPTYGTILLYYTKLYYTILYYTILYYTYYTILYYTILP